MLTHPAVICLSAPYIFFMCLMLVNFTNQWRSISSPNRLIWLFIISCREEAFDLRTKETYSAQCDSIEQAPTDVVRKDLQTTYGINKRSILCQLPTFDITKQLPQDIMHTVLEGTVQYEIRLVLLHYIQSGVVTLSQINGAILSHQYGFSEICDKPGILKESVFFGDEKYKLKYKAAQARLLLR